MQTHELISFKEQLLSLSNELTADELNKMLFVSPLGKAQREKITKGFELFEALIQRQHISPDNKEYLSKMLSDAGRPDLAAKLKTKRQSNYQGSIVQSEPSPEETAKIDCATEVIAKQLGSDWRKLGRTLGLSEVKLKDIDRNQRHLDDIAVDVITEWRSVQGSDATVKQLLEALIKCDLKLTAEKVEDKLLEMS